MMNISDFLILFFTCILLQIIFINNYKNMTNQTLNKKKYNFLIIFITSFLMFVNNYYNLMSLRIVTGILINIITCKFMFKNNITKTIFNCIIHTIIIIFLEILFSPILMFSVDNIYIFNNNIFMKSFFSLLLACISIFIFKNPKFNKFINKLNTLIINSNIFILIIPFILIFINILAIFRVIDFKNIFMLILSIFSVIFMLICLKIMINDKYNIKVVEERIKNLRESYKAYSKTIDDCRELKHNLKNDLLTLKSGVNKDSQERINEIIIKYNKNYEWINMIDEIPEGLQGLIYLKQKESESRKIKLYINTISNISTNNKDYIDLCSILGILIDNAIEASKIAKSKIIEINFKEENNHLNIKISNKYINNIDLNKIGNKNYSTKEYKSGLGLNYIKKLNNNKIKVNFKIINNVFITNILYSVKN